MKKGFLFLFFILIPALTFAQSYRKKFEIGGSLGVTHYIGDINGNFIKGDMGLLSDLQFTQMGIAIGGNLRYQISPVLGLKGNLLFGQARGTDALSPKEGNRARNLSFTTNIYEVSTYLEFPLIFKASTISRYVRSRKRKKDGAGLNGFIGVGFFYFNPMAKLNGTYYDLAPLQTEGIKYPKYSLTIPFGLAYTYSWARKYKIGFEVGMRKTFTDFIDDVHAKYVSNDELLKLNEGTGDGPLAVTLANRNPEVTDPELKKLYGNYWPGQKRGNGNTNDYYIFTTVNFSYLLSAKRRSHRAKF